MNLAIDTDALIKLTRCSAKEAVGAAFATYLPTAVHRECVEQGKAGGFPDSLRVETNIERGMLFIQKPKRTLRTERLVRDLKLSGGEADVLRLHHSGNIDLIVSDDRKFLQLLEAIGIPYTTPGPLVAALFRMRKLAREQALEHLERLAAYISEDEYLESRRAIGEG